MWFPLTGFPAALALLQAVVLLTVIAADACRVAAAHAIIISAEPAENSTVPPGAVCIRLVFNSRIDAARSRLSLQDPEGRLQSVAAETVDADEALTGRADVGVVGKWTLHWLALSRDGHITRGDLHFFVRHL